MFCTLVVGFRLVTVVLLFDCGCGLPVCAAMLMWLVVMLLHMESSTYFQNIGLNAMAATETRDGSVLNLVWPVCNVH